MNHIDVLMLVKSLVGYEILEKDSPILQTLDHAIEVLERLDDVEGLEEVIDKVKIEGMLHILPEDKERLCTAIRTKLLGAE